MRLQSLFRNSTKAVMVVTPWTHPVENNRSLKGCVMACKRCDSDEQETFNSEIAIHHPSHMGLDLHDHGVSEAAGLFAMCLHGVHCSRQRNCNTSCNLALD